MKLNVHGDYKTKVINLYDFGLFNQNGIDIATDAIRDFSCYPNPEIETFLKEKAISYEMNDITRTMLVFKSDLSRFYGFFSLAVRDLHVDDLGSSAKRRLFGTAFQIRQVVSCVLLGQFAKNYTLPELNRINGMDLMDLVMTHVQKCKSIIPFRAIYVECQDNPYLRFFYEKTGFKFYRSNPLNGLLIYIKGV